MLVMIKQIGDKKQLVIDLEIPGEKPKITMRFRNEGEYICFQCKGETNPRFDKYADFHCKGEASVQYKLLFSNYEMKNEKIDFAFKILLANYTVVKESQRIEYFTENNEYNEIVRITYNIEKEEEEDVDEFTEI